MVDLILCMTVNPGFGGQSFIDAVADKVRTVRRMVGDRPIDIEVDGGIGGETATRAAAAGANALLPAPPCSRAAAGPTRANIDAIRLRRNAGTQLKNVPALTGRRATDS